MSWKSSTQRYGSVAIAFHWVSALAILVQFGLGFAAASATNAASQANLLRAHVVLGVVVVALTLLRIGWWLIDRTPAAVAGMPSWQARSERVVRVLLYLLVLILGASGLAVLIQSRAGDLLFGGPPSFAQGGGALPNFTRFPPMLAHLAAMTALLALAGLHVVAALYHHFWRRDGLLGRMWKARAGTAS